MDFHSIFEKWRKQPESLVACYDRYGLSTTAHHGRFYHLAFAWLKNFT